MKIEELRNLQSEELNAQIKKSHADLFKLRFHSDEQENQRKGDIRKLKAGIARMKTVLRQRQLEAAAATPEKESNNG